MSCFIALLLVSVASLSLFSLYKIAVHTHSSQQAGRKVASAPQALQNHSVRKSGPSRKYFHESSFDAHYDSRFGLSALSYDDKRSRLSALIRAFLLTMDDIGIETWLMHGSLLGWYWNQKILP